jgi:hypothetical protein
MFNLGGLEALFVAMLFLWLLPVVPLVFYLLDARRALRACAPERRRMEPDLVWMQLVPLFGLVWQFFVVLAVSGSLGAELRHRGIAAEPDPGQPYGLAMCALSACGVIPFVGLVTLPASLVCMVLYWVRVRGAKNLLVVGV